MSPEAVSPMQGDFEREREGESGALTGCREAVEILTRNPKKGKSSYSISGSFVNANSPLGSFLRRQ
ncbi:hypothetical protein PAXRUDRAFT_822998 [Paxillus rubicundulus Ve08.2h10]|uniref:Uncharacterized protein n=1 Tax=Paxillus rubicundulus Ve08.2h10 TaxID=930991 RepID=A0A0D0ECE5_9AGAM|nr:hypothetical protein PAXRUDRAFT_822998 [Paxillus rubicundulus Ve08.2h10]